jgi:hypothetical protein
VLQHVAIEVASEQLEACARFWELLGFRRVAQPEALGDNFVWVERAGTQIHLIGTDEATVPALGHPAVVVEGFERTLERLGAAGHEAQETRELWGARRGFAIAPGGHRVELMASPPPTGG